MQYLHAFRKFNIYRKFFSQKLVLQYASMAYKHNNPDCSND